MKFRKIIPWMLAAVIAAGSGNAIAASRGLQLEYKASEAVGAPVAGSLKLYDASYALVIGNDAYKAWPRLSNAVRDAELVAAELESQGFEVSLRRNLTSTQLKSVLEEFYIDKGADKNARLMVWYAGHGETVNGEGYLVPVDAPRNTSGRAFKRKALSLRRFGEFVRQAEAKHAMAVFDSCFAGTIFGSTRSKAPPAVTRSTGLPVRQFLTSGDAGEAVSDDGTFRKLFIRALRGEERADANGDGYLTGSELGNYLGDRIVNLEMGQTPRYGKLRDPEYDRGDFVFSLKRPAEVAAPISGSGFSLRDLKEQQKQDQVEQAWDLKLAEMKTAYSETEQFEAEEGSTELKVQAWQRFGTAFVQDNPFSNEDDQLRQQGAARAEHWLGRKQVAAVITVPKIELPSPVKPEVEPDPVGRRPGDTFRDCDECPEMVVIPKGSFRMGDLYGGDDDVEKPVHRVDLNYLFAVSKFEIMQAQWQIVMGNNPSAFKGKNRPVERVSWNGVQQYLENLNAKLGLTGRSDRYRLLSEAEWEYAARGGTETKYHFGDTVSTSQAQLNVNENEGTASVGSYSANAFGLYDMHGNVWEWTSDCWNNNYEGAPTDGGSWQSGDCGAHVSRGGSWNFYPFSARSAGRNRTYTMVQDNNFGFRVAKTLPK
jgi:formylglycine-generating enzyme required for sulfatase activity